MCGRYAATSRPEDLVEEFDIEQVMTGEPSRSLLSAPQDPPPGAPDYNVAPTKQAPVILTRAPRSTDPSYDEDAPPVRQLRLLTWGLVPSWAKDVKVGLRMINARAESVLEKSAFAKAAASRRALVPASGWYEWQVSPTATTPAASRASSRSSSTTPTGRRWRWPPCTSSGATAASRTRTTRARG